MEIRKRTAGGGKEKRKKKGKKGKDERKKKKGLISFQTMKTDLIIKYIMSSHKLNSKITPLPKIYIST